MANKTVVVYWFRRDLRLTDNTALSEALRSGLEVLPLFIFDDEILQELEVDDPRVYFIYEELEKIHHSLREYGSGLTVLKGKPLDIWKKLIHEHSIGSVYVNSDYEPYAIQRDENVHQLLKSNTIGFYSCKDQVIFEKNEILKKDGLPYTVFTPYKNAWLREFNVNGIGAPPIPKLNNFLPSENQMPSLAQLGLSKSMIKVRDYDLSAASGYAQSRNIPSLDSTSYLSPHLRFGTVSIRQVIRELPAGSETFLSELIWREFFMQILYHFPNVVQGNFRAKYDGIQWLNDPDEFAKWSEGKTGYPLVDAGMRQLNQSGYMHNRVRMVTAGFLVKHLLIDWRWGESYFAKKLLDYELSSNNGNWQWAAGTGCDAAPYFRVFNPETQQQKFDPQFEYIKKWIPEFGTPDYAQPMVDHKMSRERAIRVYKSGIGF